MPWNWTNNKAESDCARNIKNGVKEVVLEKLWSIFEHWSLYAEVHGLVDDALLAKKMKREQQRTVHKAWATQKLGGAAARKSEVAYQIQKVWRGIDRDFNNARTLAKAKAACAKYVEGKLGVDWFIHDMFHPELQRSQREKAMASIQSTHNQHAYEHAGDDTLSLSRDQLKPLFRLHPDLSSLY